MKIISPLILVFLGLFSFGMFVSSYLALWDYPLVAITSAIWGSAGFISFMLFSFKLEKARKNGR